MSEDKEKFEGPMHGIECFGASTLGKRGQVVIPAEIRKQMNLKPGEQFMVLLANDSVVFVPGDKFEKMISQLDQKVSKFKELSEEK